MMTLKEINEKMLAFFEERLKTMGSLDGGLQNYYEQRIKNKAILGELDIHILKEVQKRYAPPTRIHEMACGAAQLGHALSLLGYHVMASEILCRRHKLAVDLGKYVGSNCRIILGDSRKINFEVKLHVTVNAASSLLDIKKDIDFYSEATSKGSDVIINADLYGKNKSAIREVIKNDDIEIEELGKGFILLGRNNG